MHHGFTAARDYVRAGDTLAVWRLDRLGRSLAKGAAQQLIEGVTTLGGARSASAH